MKTAQDPVLTLTIDGDDQAYTSEEGFKTPCTFKGLMAGFSGGALGFVFGFGTYPFLFLFLLPMHPLHTHALHTMMQVATGFVITLEVHSGLQSAMGGNLQKHLGSWVVCMQRQHVS